MGSAREGLCNAHTYKEHEEIGKQREISENGVR